MHGIITKVGILPFRRRANGDPEWLVHQPLPKQNERETVAFGLARGTRAYRDADGKLIDLRDKTVVAIIDPSTIEPLADTAWREAEEELGIVPDHVVKRSEGLVDLGVCEYASESKGTYPIHFFACHIHPDAVLNPANDAQAVRWATRSELASMVENGKFKPAYLTVVDTLFARLQRIGAV